MSNKSSVWGLEHSNNIIEKVHLRSVCRGSRCPIHNRSNHPLRKYVQKKITIQSSNSFTFFNVTVRTCNHNIVHIDPDESDEYLAKHGATRLSLKTLCDGCCISVTNEEF